MDSQLKLLNDKIDTIDQKQCELKQENELLRNRVESLKTRRRIRKDSRRGKTIYFMDYLKRQIKDGTCVREMLTDKMGLDGVEDDNVISIERAHRLGRRRQQQDQPKPLVVKVSRYKYRKVVWNNRSKLKDTNSS